MRAVLVNGIDVTDTPLPLGARDQSLKDVEIVMTDRITTISGGVADDRGRPVDGSRVIAFPQDRQLWYPDSRFLKMSRSTREGTYTIRGLPPGEYYVAVIEPPAQGDSPDAWQDPELLDVLARRATRVMLSEGQTVSLTLKTGR